MHDDLTPFSRPYDFVTWFWKSLLLHPKTFWTMDLFVKHDVNQSIHPLWSVFRRKKILIELVSKNEINSLHGNRDDLISFLPSGFVLHVFFVYFEHLSETHWKAMTFKCSYQILINRNDIEKRWLDSRFHPVLLCLFHVIWVSRRVTYTETINLTPECKP